jgi:hypothetical protein
MNSIDTEIDILFNSLSNKEEFYKSYKLFKRRYLYDEYSNKRNKAISILSKLLEKIKENKPEIISDENNKDIYYDLVNAIDILGNNELS